MRFSVLSLALSDALSLTNAGIRRATDSMKWPGTSLQAAGRLHKTFVLLKTKLHLNQLHGFVPKSASLARYGLLLACQYFDFAGRPT